MSYRLGTWDPLHDLGGLQKRLTNMFGGDGDELLSLKGDTDWEPAVDVAEDDKNFIITADLPEVSKEDAKVIVQDGLLTLSGERHRNKETKDKKYHRIERSYGKYERSFRIPGNVMVSDISADFQDGVLKIVMPKMATKTSKGKQIKIK